MVVDVVLIHRSLGLETGKFFLSSSSSSSDSDGKKRSKLDALGFKLLARAEQGEAPVTAWIISAGCITSGISSFEAEGVARGAGSPWGLVSSRVGFADRVPRTRDAVRALWARLLAFDIEHRAGHEACATDVVPVEGTEDLDGDVADAERYGIARGDDPLTEVDFGGLGEIPRPTFISQYLAPE
ncbi:hypothetical protein Droror1_Dr00025441, partial [Drosera rotundifolia]